MPWPGLGPFPFPRRADPRATGRTQQLAGTSSASASGQGNLTKQMALAGNSQASASGAGKLTRARALAAAVTAAATTSGNFVRNKVLAAAVTAAASGASALLRSRKLAGTSSATATPAAALSLTRSQNVVVDFTYQDAQVSEVSMADVGLKPEYFRSNESRALYQRLIFNGSPVDLTGWTIELWVNGAALKTITTASAAATAGLIQNQATNLGQYFFTILAADLVTLLGSNSQVTANFRVRYVTPDTAPPRVFSNVTFAAVIVSP